MSSYTVVLTRAPEETVRVQATALEAGERDRRAGALGINLGKTSDISTMSAAGETTLFFNRTNWFKPQTVYVYAPQDAVAEGRESIQIQHKVTQGAVPGDGGAYDNLASLGVTVDVFDDDVSDLIIVPLDGSSAGLFTQVFEDGSIGNATDTFAAFLTRAPGALVSIDFSDVSEQLRLSTDGTNFDLAVSLDFTSGTYLTPQIITIQADDDSDKEARHYARIEATLNGASGRADFVNVGVNNISLDFFNTLTGTGEFVVEAGATPDRFFVTGPDFTLTGTDNFEIIDPGAIGASAPGTRFELAVLTGYEVGDVFSFTIGATTVTHTVTGDTDSVPQTVAEVVNAVVEQITNNSGVLGVTATALAEVFRIEANVPGSAFTYDFTRQTGSDAPVPAATQFAFVTYQVIVKPETPQLDDLYSLVLTPASGRGGGTFNYIVGSNGEPDTFDRLDVEIADDDSPQVVVNEGNGVIVSEESQEFYLGSRFCW